MNSRIAYYLSPLGLIEISGTYDHVDALTFTNTDSPPENLPDPSGAILQCIRQLNEYFKGTLTAFNFPIHHKGTLFQQKVWEELLLIPFGKTISYLDLAKRLGDEKCIRAAASANGRNPLAIVVPCHRVIGSDGSLTGYAGGLKRKQWLLDHEARVNGSYQKLF
jgi:methylated-DNA-[protein]-cysteine S-methyltransferase